MFRLSTGRSNGMDGGTDKGQHGERATYARWGCRKWRGNEGWKAGRQEGRKECCNYSRTESGRAFTGRVINLMQNRAKEPARMGEGGSSLPPSFREGGASCPAKGRRVGHTKHISARSLPPLSPLLFGQFCATPLCRTAGALPEQHERSRKLADLRKEPMCV